MMEKEEIFSKVLRAGRRTYFFDVRSTRADDYYLTITESKKFTNDDGSFYYKKHKIYLYKEDFDGFKEILEEMTNFIIKANCNCISSNQKSKHVQLNYIELNIRIYLFIGCPVKCKLVGKDEFLNRLLMKPKVIPFL